AGRLGRRPELDPSEMIAPPATTQRDESTSPANQASTSWRAMENGPGSMTAPSSTASSSSDRVHHVASLSSLGSTVTATGTGPASAWNPSISESGNGHGCEEW